METKYNLCLEKEGFVVVILRLKTLLVLLLCLSLMIGGYAHAEYNSVREIDSDIKDLQSLYEIRDRQFKKDCDYGFSLTKEEDKPCVKLFEDRIRIVGQIKRLSDQREVLVELEAAQKEKEKEEERKIEAEKREEERKIREEEREQKQLYKLIGIISGVVFLMLLILTVVFALIIKKTRKNNSV